MRDFAQVKYDGRITGEVADYALNLLDVDRDGLDANDRLILGTIIKKFGGGPVGLDTLAASIGEDAGTLEDVYEPYLIQNGFINRTPRGRVATNEAYLNPHALDDFHVHVLHRARSSNYGTHLRSEDPAREGPATGAHPVPQPRQLRSGARGTREGWADRPHRLGRAVSHPSQAPQEEGRGGRRCPERKGEGR